VSRSIAVTESPAPLRYPDQSAYWNDEAGPRWVALQARLDALFASLTVTAIDFAAPRTGDRVVDIGCGCGATLLELSPRVGPKGKVLGVDISAVMLEAARKRVAAQRLGNTTLLRADASAHPFEPATFDLAFSRFGVMFFDDSMRAFAAIRRSLRPGGRLAFVTWRRLSDSPWFLVPYLAAKLLLPPQPPPDPEAPGPFRFADPELLRRILSGAGFSAIEVTPHDSMLQPAGPGELSRAVDFALQVGPVSRALAPVDAGVKAAATAAIRAELAKHESAQGIALSAGTWLVSARA
jgi:SAM-dependent methyltransferase